MGLIDTIAATKNRNTANTLSCWQGGWHASYTLADLDGMALRLARHLRCMGLRRGDRIGICAKNCIEWVLLDLAALKAGVQTAGFEPGRYTKDPDLVARYGLNLLYTDEPLHGAGVIDIRTVVPSIYAIADGEPFATRYAPTDCPTIKFTSGSTGEPKGLEASVQSIEQSLTAVQRLFMHGAQDKLLVLLPLSLLQQRYWVYSALLFGHDLAITGFEQVFAVMPQARPTVIMGVPGFFDALRRRIELHAEETGAGVRDSAQAMTGGRVRYLWTGSAPASRGTLEFFDAAGLPLYEGFGMNETCIVSKNHPGAHRRGSVGRVLPHKRVRIDEHGVLHVGSDQPVNTRYLFSAPGDTERMFGPDGEVRTGDLARIDADGYLYILGRCDDVVVLANGKNIATPRIEQRIADHPDVAQCVVLGAGRPFLVAVVVATGVDARPRVQQHVQALNRELPAAERIGRVLFADAPFSVGNGQLGTQFKPRRSRIESDYRDSLDQIYGAYA